MKPEVNKFLNTVQKGDKISLILAGLVLDGTVEELQEGCVVLSDASSPSIKKGHYNLSIPFESIYAWGKKEKKKKAK